MTISAFAAEHRQAVNWNHVPVRRAYREHKRRQAEARQAAFDEEVGRVAREQNIDRLTALDVLRRRRRHEHRAGSR